MEEPKLVLDAKALLGEGPFWDYEKKLLYWLDIEKKQIHMYNPKINTDKVIKTIQLVGTAVPRKKGGMVLAMEKGFFSMDEESQELAFIKNPEEHLPGNRFNDGKCDPAGRLWAGTMSLNGEIGLANLYCLNTDLSIRKMIEGVSISNGIVWSPDDKYMYYIDTPTKEVKAFDFDIDTGNITNKRIAVTIPDNEGYPDGMAIDSDGMIWVAHWDGWKVSRWNPQTGEKMNEVFIPAARVTACAFGGENLDELYITTARKGLSDKELNNQPHAGGLFCIKTKIKGMPTHKFGG